MMVCYLLEVHLRPKGLDQTKQTDQAKLVKRDLRQCNFERNSPAAR